MSRTDHFLAEAGVLIQGLLLYKSKGPAGSGIKIRPEFGRELVNENSGRDLTFFEALGGIVEVLSIYWGDMYLAGF